MSEEGHTQVIFHTGAELSPIIGTKEGKEKDRPFHKGKKANLSKKNRPALQEHPFFKKVPNPQRKDKFQKTAQSGNNDKEEKPALICRKRANKIDNHDRLLTADLRRRGRDRLFL